MGQALARDSMDSPDFTLFFTEETEPLARKVAAVTNHVNLGTVRWKCVSRVKPLWNMGRRGYRVDG